MWAMFSSSLFTEWEIARLSQRGDITLAEPLLLAGAIRQYLNSTEGGLIQQHRLNNPERTHLLSVKRLLSRLRWAVAIVLAAGLLLLAIAARRRAARHSLRRIVQQSALLILGLALCATAALAFSGFGRLFIELHQLLFAQPDWVFPAGSTLTALYPPQLFLHGFIAWLGMMLATALILAMVAHRFTSNERTLQ